MSLPYSSSSPADSKEKIGECEAAGEFIKDLLEKDIKPRDIMTKTAFDNAITMIMMTGRSENERHASQHQCDNRQRVHDFFPKCGLINPVIQTIALQIFQLIPQGSHR